MNTFRSGILSIAIAAFCGFIAVFLTNWQLTRDFAPATLHVLVFLGLTGWVALRTWKRNRAEDWLQPWWIPGLAFFGVYGVAFGVVLAHDPERALLPWLGVLFASFSALLVFSLMKKNEDNTNENDLLQRFPPQRFRLVMLLWLVAGTVIWGVYIAKMGGLPLFADAVEGGRVAMAEKGGGALRLGVYSLVVWGWFVWYDAFSGKTLGRFTRFGGTLWVAILLILLANRAPLVHLFAVPVLMGLAWKGRGQGSATFTSRLPALLALAAMAWIGFGMLGAMRLLSDPTLRHYPEIAYYADGGHVFQLGMKIPADYLLTTARNYLQVFDIAPEFYGFRYGGSYLDPLWTALPGKQYALAMQLKSVLGMQFKGGGVVPGVLGEAWINFGALGFVLVPALVSCVLVGLYRMHRRGKSPYWTLGYLFLLVHLGSNMQSGLMATSIFPVFVVGVLVVMRYAISIESDKRP